MTTTRTTMQSPIGELVLSNADGVLSELRMRTRTRERTVDGFVAPGFELAVAELSEYFAGKRSSFTVPVRPRGNSFELRVWELLLEIPYGETRSYGDIATELGDPTLAREVGAANARNPIAVIVPCHRVVGADGSLTGYAGGLERKRYLLDLEAGRVPLFAP
jgi:methylated-DNA-[protein]-cysteine S-methyltransferase